MNHELTLFEELIDLSTEEREHRLAAVRERDPELALGVEQLLAADASAGGILEDEAPTLVELEVDRQPPFERLGAWRLGELLGAGGMGEVWSASREEGGFSQRAAVKLVRAGMTSDHVVARFLVERQVLSRLEHPSIARILDGGLAPDGRPWFAMELVDGLPLLEFVDRHQPNLRERLELFLRIAQPVELAHRKLVVHRDLKPGNVLVDDNGTPTLLDFGVAKILEEEAGEGNTKTEFRALTPAYAAPEQILGDPVTTATDVYSLGVLLYQLLTGALPYQRGSATFGALAQEVQKESLTLPSLRVERAELELGRSKAHARSQARVLAGDLDTILSKALQREPERRYPSVALFAGDVERYLTGRPITARPDTVGYRARKFVRRHTLGVTAATLVVLSVFLGLTVSILQTRRANTAAATARLEAQRADRVKGFLISVFEQADPSQSLGAELTAQQILTEGARRLEQELADEPEVRAELFEVVARIQGSLGLFPESVANAESAARERAALFGPSSAEHALSLTTAGRALLGQGLFDEAAARFDQATAILEPQLERHPVAYADALSGRAETRLIQGDLEGSVRDQRRAHALVAATLGENSAEALAHLSGLAVLETESGTFAEAARMFRQILSVLESRHDGDTPEILAVVLNLATALHEAGETEEALTLFARVVEGRRTIYGPGHPALADALVIASLRLSRAGRFDEALEALAEARATYEPLDHPELGSVDNYRGLVLVDLGRFAEAESAFEASVARFTKDRGPEAVLTAVALLNLAHTISELSRFEEADERYVRAIAILSAAGELENPRLLRGRLNWIANLRKLGRFDAAWQALDAATETATEKLAPGHARLAECDIERARLILAEDGPEANELASAAIIRAEAILREAQPTPGTTRNLTAAKAELAAARNRPD